MGPETQLEDITRTITLAVAPVFLLSAIGTILSVLSTRLGRVVDRARALERDLPSEGVETRPARVEELRTLEKRARLIYRALTFGTTAALLVCVLIAVAFLGYLFNAHLGVPVALLFILALVCFGTALSFFLREVFQAIALFGFNLPPEVTAKK